MNSVDSSSQCGFSLPSVWFRAWPWPASLVARASLWSKCLLWVLWWLVASNIERSIKQLTMKPRTDKPCNCQLLLRCHMNVQWEISVNEQPLVSSYIAGDLPSKIGWVMLGLLLWTRILLVNRPLIDIAMEGPPGYTMVCNGYIIGLVWLVVKNHQLFFLHISMQLVMIYNI